MTRLALFIGLLPSLSLVFAQDLGVPTTWREFNNSRLLAERISIAKSAIDTILPQLDMSNSQFDGIGFWQSAKVFSSMANFDHLASSTVYKDQVINGLTAAHETYRNFDPNGYNDDAMYVLPHTPLLLASIRGEIFVFHIPSEDVR
ncbi:hypothetical protein F5877DRAFT_86648 [Lentinula edodes]|nr:hypothetical protein F5877DRAFT_86648 [Lentinula edodes]